MPLREQATTQGRTRWQLSETVTAPVITPSAIILSAKKLSPSNQGTSAINIATAVKRQVLTLGIPQYVKDFSPMLKTGDSI